MKHEWEHDALAADLAAHLTSENRMTWQNMQLGSSGSQRPDVYAVYKSYSRPNPVVYECKISISDFRSDITTGKWRGYLDFAWSVVFAAPAGLIPKEQLPEMCGLMVRGPNGWKMAKRAVVCPRPLDQDCMLKLLIDGVTREGPAVRARKWKDYDTTRRFTEKFGAEAARYVSDAAETHRRIERAEYEAKNIVERANKEAARIRERAEIETPKLWTELLSVLELKPNCDAWKVEQKIRELRNSRAGSEEVQALRNAIRFMDRFVQQNAELVAEKPSGAVV